MCVSMHMPDFGAMTSRKRRALRQSLRLGRSDDNMMGDDMMVKNEACEKAEASAMIPIMCSGQCVQMGFTSA